MEKQTADSLTAQPVMLRVRTRLRNTEMELGRRDGGEVKEDEIPAFPSASLSLFIPVFALSGKGKLGL